MSLPSSGTTDGVESQGGCGNTPNSVNGGFYELKVGTRLKLSASEPTGPQTGIGHIAKSPAILTWPILACCPGGRFGFGSRFGRPLRLYVQGFIEFNRTDTNVRDNASWRKTFRCIPRPHPPDPAPTPPRPEEGGRGTGCVGQQKGWGGVGPKLVGWSSKTDPTPPTRTLCLKA